MVLLQRFDDSIVAVRKLKPRVKQTTVLLRSFLNAIAKTTWWKGCFRLISTIIRLLRKQSRTRNDVIVDRRVGPKLLSSIGRLHTQKLPRARVVCARRRARLRANLGSLPYSFSLAQNILRAKNILDLLQHDHTHTVREYRYSENHQTQILEDRIRTECRKRTDSNC